MDPLIRLIRKNQPFSWGVKVKNAFQFLRVFFTTAPLLIHVDPTKPFVLEINAFDFALKVILSQLGKNNFFHPIGFCFHKFSPSEITRFMIRNFLPSWMLLKSGVICLKELNMKLLCI
jgi:hypothetical protein